MRECWREKNWIYPLLAKFGRVRGLRHRRVHEHPRRDGHGKDTGRRTFQSQGFRKAFQGVLRRAVAGLVREPFNTRTRRDKYEAAATGLHARPHGLGQLEGCLDSHIERRLKSVETHIVERCHPEDRRVVDERIHRTRHDRIDGLLCCLSIGEVDDSGRSSRAKRRDLSESLRVAVQKNQPRSKSVKVPGYGSTEPLGRARDENALPLNRRHGLPPAEPIVAPHPRPSPHRVPSDWRVHLRTSPLGVSSPRESPRRTPATGRRQTHSRCLC